MPVSQKERGESRSWIPEQVRSTWSQLQCTCQNSDSTPLSCGIYQKKIAFKFNAYTFSSQHVDLRLSTLPNLKESSRQRPRSAMSWKTPGEVRARTCGTKSPSRLEALRFIDSSKSPSRSARRFGAAGSSPDFSRGFSRHGASRPLSWTFFQCTLLSYPGQPSYSLPNLFIWSSSIGRKTVCTVSNVHQNIAVKGLLYVPQNTRKCI